MSLGCGAAAMVTLIIVAAAGGCGSADQSTGGSDVSDASAIEAGSEPEAIAATFDRFFELARAEDAEGACQLIGGEVAAEITESEAAGADCPDAIQGVLSLFADYSIEQNDLDAIEVNGDTALAHDPNRGGYSGPRTIEFTRIDERWRITSWDAGL